MRSVCFAPIASVALSLKSLSLSPRATCHRSRELLFQLRDLLPDQVGILVALGLLILRLDSRIFRQILWPEVAFITYE